MSLDEVIPINVERCLTNQWCRSFLTAVSLSFKFKLMTRSHIEDLTRGTDG